MKHDFVKFSLLQESKNQQAKDTCSFICFFDVIVFEICDRCQCSYLGVFKRHRPDPFWLTHANDGWSFALDYKVTNANRDDLWKHCARLTEIVLAGRGKFYFAKDLVIGQRDMLRMFPPEKTQAFLALKRELDPEMLLQTNLYRRVFGGLIE